MNDEGAVKPDDEAMEVGPGSLQKADSANQPQSERATEEKRPMNQTNLDEALAAAENADLPPEMRSAIEFIQKNITQLRDGDLLRQVDALVDINEAVGGFTTKGGEGTAGEIGVQ